MSKRRRYVDENRRFKYEWEHIYAFTDTGDKPMCLICKTPLAIYKVWNIRRHHEKHHAYFHNQYPLNSELRHNMISELKSGLFGQTLPALAKEPTATIEAGMVISWNITRAKRPFYDEEFLKKNISEVVAVLDPKNLKLQRLIAQINISRQISDMRTFHISEDIEMKMHNDLKNCIAFSIAIDNSININDVPQLAVFVRYVSSDFAIKEEILEIMELNEQSHGIDIKNALDVILTNSGVCLNKLVSVATNGEAAILDQYVGLTDLLNNDPNIPEFMPIHCIIHLEKIVLKYFKFANVINVIYEVVNFIQANANASDKLYNKLEFVKINESHSPFVIILSNINVLNKFIELLEQIGEFLIHQKMSCFPQIKDEAWIHDLMFYADLIPHVQTLHLGLQGNDKIISDFTQMIFSFQRKMELLKNDITWKKFHHFPNLKKKLLIKSEIEEVKLAEYVNGFEILLNDFHARFFDLQKFKPCFGFLVNPFMVDVINDGFPQSLPPEPSASEIELLELQEDQGLQMTHKSNSTIEFWKLVPVEKYPQLKRLSCRLISIFGTNNCVESLHSTMKYMKANHSKGISNERLIELLRTISTSYCPDFKGLTDKLQPPEPKPSTSTK